MKALVQTVPGSIDSLQVSDVPTPAPGPGQIRVKVHCCGLNPVDAKLLLDRTEMGGSAYVPGLDFAGVVDEVDPSVHGFAVGDRVSAHGAIGLATALGEYTVADAQTVAKIPDGVSFASAAALPCAGLTALQSIERIGVASGDTLLVMAGGGAVGGFAVQLASLRGARVIATASNADKDRVTALGARRVIDHHHSDIYEAVMGITGNRGVDGIIDSLPAPSATNGLKMLAFGGQIACIGDRPDLASIPPFSTAPSIHEIALGAAHASGDLKARRWLRDRLGFLMDLVLCGQLDVQITKEVPLNRAAAALKTVLGGGAHGKIVVQIG